MVDIAEIDQKSLLTQVEDSSQEIASWSEDRQNEFVATFQQRTKVTRYILLATASKIWEKAINRHFVSAKHYRAITKDLLPERQRWQINTNFTDLANALLDGPPHGYGAGKVGGRDTSSLALIAEQRANQVLNSLPPLAKVVSIIDIETAKKIDRKAKVEADGEELREKLEAVCGTISLSEQDPKMTIGEFLAMVQSREDERQRLIKRMNTLAIEGQKLESEICKTLYNGLPGLSEAVIDVIRNHVEQSIAFDATGRRVEEQVKFGNSSAAVELLRHFEKDELTVSDDVKAKFDAALEKLKVAKNKKPAAKRIRS